MWPRFQVIQSLLERILRYLQLLYWISAQILRFWRSNRSLKLENFVSKFSVHCSNLLCTMYQKVGKPFADFTLFKVGKWNADFSSKQAQYWNRQTICRFHQKLILNSNGRQPSNFENSYLPVHSSDLRDLWLIGNLLKGATSLMLSLKPECTIFEIEFLVERKPGVFTNQA